MMTLPKNPFPRRSRLALAASLALLSSLMLSPVPTRAEGEAPASAPAEAAPAPQAMQAQDTGVAVNGGVKDSSVNNNQNNLTTGNNTNMNLLNPNITPILLAPNESRGGNSILMTPRNPLPLPNAALGRSNFGLQFGVQNNPILGGLNGGNNALGWFMQGGVSIPFGRIPEVYNNPKNARLDDVRLEDQERQRMVFGNRQPSRNVEGQQVETKVQGKVTGLGAYNFATIPSAPIALPDGAPGFLPDAVKLQQAKVLALSPAEAYSHPLNRGKRVGVIEVGLEYAYLGHTRSGWIKILLPNGSEGWTNAPFEYIKNDYTEVDNLAHRQETVKTAAVGLKDGKAAQ